jgi:hypothetical protein
MEEPTKQEKEQKAERPQSAKREETAGRRRQSDKPAPASFILSYQNMTELRVPSGRVTVLDSGAVYPSNLGTEITREDLQAINRHYKQDWEKAVEEFGESAVRAQSPDGPREVAESDVTTMANGQKRQRREWEDRS